MRYAEVCYALANQQTVCQVELFEQDTVEAVILRSGIIDQFPQIDIHNDPIGIFGEIVTLSTQVAEGDRIEIYRKLIIDPKEARRIRAKHKN